MPFFFFKRKTFSGIILQAQTRGGHQDTRPKPWELWQRMRGCPPPAGLSVVPGLGSCGHPCTQARPTPTGLGKTKPQGHGRRPGGSLCAPPRTNFTIASRTARLVAHPRELATSIQSRDCSIACSATPSRTPHTLGHPSGTTPLGPPAGSKPPLRSCQWLPGCFLLLPPPPPRWQ